MSTNTITARKNSPTFLAGMALLCAGSAAAIVTAVLITFGGHDATPAPAPQPHPVSNVAQLQRELGQLNYYEGTDTGVLNPQTVSAIEYLQRDAHLPQTGRINAATSTALAHFLKDGNNQMGG